MPSLIEGYEFDIFISYRHNDNKSMAGGKGWVTDFVDNLRVELEATVKDRISIYFDENPHDGLLETHNVDESLAAKLHSLIFIPIVSQTYCDPESFAWRNEFQKFNNVAAADKFGPIVKLRNGNVSNRVLPMRIHELDPSDLKMLETELNGKIRAIDFIFKSSGVNRPLRANEDDPLKNANRSLYRDQINKAANAIKDIINGLKNPENTAVERPGQTRTKPASIPARGKSVTSRSVAVMPFGNRGHAELEYLSDGLAIELQKLLSNVRDLKVADSASSFQLKDSKIPLNQLAERLQVSSIVEGTVQRQGEKIAVTVHLTSAGTGTGIWSEVYEREADGVVKLLREVAILIAGKLEATVHEGEQKSIDKVPTRSGAAYERFLKGRYLIRRQGEGLLKSLNDFREAINLDPQFASAHASIATAYILLGHHELLSFEEAMARAKEAAIAALQLDPTLMEAYSALAFISMGYEWNWPEAETYFNKVFALNPYHPTSVWRYELYLKQIIDNLKEAESELASRPHFLHAYALLHRGKFEEALKAGLKSVELDPNSFMAHRSVGLSYLGMEKYEPAVEYLLSAARLSNRHHWLLFELMGAYTLAGKNEEAQSIMEEALAHSNALPARIFNFFFVSGS